MVVVEEEGLSLADAESTTAFRGIQRELAMALPRRRKREASEMRWHDGYGLLQGSATFKDPATGKILPRESPYDRLPEAAKAVVREPVWRLGMDSTGTFLRFTTNAIEITVNHTDRFPETNLWHMPESGTDSLDIYVWSQHDNVWRHLPTATGIELYGGKSGTFRAPDTDTLLAPGSLYRTYLVYLPLRNAPTAGSLQVGIPAAYDLCTEETKRSMDSGGRRSACVDPAPSFRSRPPVVWYGTSIQATSDPYSCT